jgi:hypothetical protein
MSSDSVKLYKNPLRSEEEVSQPYQPQYKQMGIVPEFRKIPPSVAYTVHVAKVEGDENPRTRIPGIRVDTEAARQIPAGGLPNVGNNKDYTWSGMDDEIFDDVSSITIDSNQSMIDNNDFVDVESLNQVAPPSSETIEDKKFLTEQDLKDAISKELKGIDPSSIPEDEYVLLVDGMIVNIGPLDAVQEEANKLIFGDHDMFKDKSVSVDSLLVFRRVKIKVGLFLE